ncbi:cell division protein SepF [Dermatobacter hominis]|uniref:cell division protein SepF n=1 Tax=Dermatobacter hominis TaxID=2884263 RepID=UPI001D12A239|nr:cell division protein SepF [Dermatobacter hominis]UDY35983.1 cell division protein SepF [Dermatobacter hominis]
MSNFMKNARSWLGLGQDPYYDTEYADPPLDDEWVDDDEPEDDIVDVAPAAPAPTRPRAVPQRRTAAGPNVRSVPGPAPSSEPDDGDGGVRVIAATPGTGPEVDHTRGVVRPLPGVARPHVVTPRSFNDVQEVADTFKRNQPVILNLQGVDRDLSRRLIDFGSGLCYGLEGNMERVTDQVFLLTPHGAEVSDDDRRRIREGGLTADER